MTSTAKMDAETLSDILIDVPVGTSWIALREVIGPPAQMFVDLRDELRDRFVAHPSGGHLSQRHTFGRKRLFRGQHVQVLTIASLQVAVISERVAKKIQTGTGVTNVKPPVVWTLS